MRKIHLISIYLPRFHLSTAQPQSKMERKCTWSRELIVLHSEYFSYCNGINIGSEWINNLEITILR